MAKSIEKGTVVFKCPSCLKYDIFRTMHERKLATKYTCSGCGFKGPN